MTAIKGKEISIFTFSMMWPLPVWLPAWQLSEFKGFPVAYSWNTNQIVENYFDFFPVVRGNSVCQKQRWPAMLFFSLYLVCAASEISMETEQSIWNSLHYWGWLDCVKVRDRIKSLTAESVCYYTGLLITTDTRAYLLHLCYQGALLVL